MCYMFLVKIGGGGGDYLEFWLKLHFFFLFLYQKYKKRHYKTRES